MNSKKIKTGICAVWMAVILAVPSRTNAQGTVPPFETRKIEPVHLAIACHRTTNLVFPYAVKSVDRGNLDVLVQKAGGVENILQVKAGAEGFEPTNLTVVTSDGHLYSFFLTYSDNPQNINLEVGKYGYTKPPLAKFTAVEDNEAIVEDMAERVAVKKRSIHGTRDLKFETGLYLWGIFIQGDILYFQFGLENGSNIDYDIGQFRMYIRDRKKAKRTASQELEQLPVQVTGNTRVIRAQSLQSVVFAIPKFTIPDKKYLSVELMEQNGGRHLNLKVRNRSIVKALPVE